MSKKVTFGAKPQTALPLKSADDWVMNRPTEPEPAPDAGPMKRLTIDIPAALHGRIKAQCALRGIKMADEIRVLLDRHFSGEA